VYNVYCFQNKAEKFQKKFQEKKRHHLHHLKDGNDQKKSASDISIITPLPLKPTHNQMKCKFLSRLESELGRGERGKEKGGLSERESVCVCVTISFY